eukprot:TRINITY_DN8420_c0_g1_i2.p1 TRINITY_DN8420_c0_g1~~TRINITY_DN8420_c0_g1_i2.p1  ORF type:complete len:174 (-),score=20.12 TRINITY_DN8420_c0_g1_i2:4-468(-)
MTDYIASSPNRKRRKRRSAAKELALSAELLRVELENENLKFYQTEWFRFVLSLLFFVGSGFAMTLMNAFADARGPGGYPLPDLGFQLIPEIDFPDLPNIIMSVMGVATAIVIMIHPRRLMVLRRLFLIYGGLLLLRCITVISTSLPGRCILCFH